VKIYNNKPSQLQDLAQQNLQKITKPDAKESPQSTEKTVTSDRVDISGKAREVAELMSMISQMPDVRADKVAEVKKAIESGNYNINPLQIAQSILNEI